MSRPFKIRKTPKAPPKAPGRKPIYGFETLKVGDRLEIACDGDPVVMQRVRQAAFMFAKRHGWKITARAAQTQLHVYRLE